MSPHVLTGHATKPTILRTAGVAGATLLIGAEDGFFYQLQNSRAK